MFQVLATTFFSASIIIALSVIAAMLGDNMADIRRALGLSEARMGPLARSSRRRAARIVRATPRATPAPVRRAAA